MVLYHSNRIELIKSTQHALIPPSTDLTSLRPVSPNITKENNPKLRKQIPSPKKKNKYFPPKGSSSIYLAVLGLLTFHI